MILRQKNWKFVLLFAMALGGSDTAMGQVVLSGAYGTAGSVPGPNHQITAGMGRQAGANLFQSFSTFNLPAGQTATFSGPASIGRVIATVNGHTPANVGGTISCTISGADFYLIDPAGVIFGPDARLNTSGSFVVATADQIKFADGTILTTNDASQATVTTAPPAAFGFLGASAGQVQIQGSTLQVNAGKSLTVLGQSVAASGAILNAPAGALSIASIQNGQADMAADGVTIAHVEDGQASPVLGTMQITNNSIVQTNGDSGGSIGIWAGDLQITGSQISSATTGEGTGGTVSLNANSLEIQQGGLVSAATFGPGAGGNMVVAVSGAIALDGSGVPASTFTGLAAVSQGDSATGRAGSISINAGTIALTNNAEISASSLSPGAAGDITLKSNQLTIFNGGQILTQTKGIGDAGMITVNSSAINIDGNSQRLTGIISDARDAGQSGVSPGTGGNIVVDGTFLSINNLGVISATTFGPKNGGSISIDVNQINMDGAGLVPFTGIGANTQGGEGAGAGGSISIQCASMNIINEAGIAANTFGPGRGGEITVGADNLFIRGDGAPFDTGILAQSQSTDDGSGAGGDISLSSTFALMPPASLRASGI